MSNYSVNPGMVRVDFFKPGGKWYMTEAWNMTGFWDEITPVDAVEKMLERDERGAALLKQFIVVVLQPYHRLEYPVCLVPKP